LWAIRTNCGSSRRTKKLLQTLARATGGVYDPPPDAVFRNDDEQAERATPLWPYLLMAAAALFLADVALRRIDFSIVFGDVIHRARYREGVSS
jgi:hypothetical protein